MKPHNFSLRQLQYLIAVADTGRFRRAAELCHVSQPALSAQLAQLESVLGFRVFERDRRRVLLTREGEELIARARGLLTEADDLIAAAARLGDPLAGTVRLGVIPTIAPYALPELAPAIRTKFPRLRLLWREEKTDVLVRALNAGALDGALLALRSDVRPFEREVIAKDPFMLAAPPGHPLARKNRVRSEELEGTTVLLLEDGHCFREQALALCLKLDAHEADFRATSLATLTQMVVGGAGVTLLPALSVPIENRAGALVVRSFAEPSPGRTIVLIWRPRSPAAGALRQVATVIRGAWPRNVGAR